MKLRVPWNTERANSLAARCSVDEAAALQTDLAILLVEQRWLHAALALDRFLAVAGHLVLGFKNMPDWWRARFPDLRYGLLWDLRWCSKAIAAAPRLEHMHVSGAIAFDDLVAVGQVAQHLHESNDLELFAVDKGVRRSMVLALMSNPRRGPANLKGKGRKLTVSDELLAGDWKRAAAAYRAWARPQPGLSRRRKLAPPFEVVLVWLLEDWRRLVADEKKRAREVKP